MNTTTKTLITSATLTAGAFVVGTQNVSADTNAQPSEPNNSAKTQTSPQEKAAQVQIDQADADQNVAVAQASADTAQAALDQANETRQNDQKQFDDLNKQIAQGKSDVNNQPELLKQAQSDVNQYTKQTQQLREANTQAQSKLNADKEAVTGANNDLASAASTVAQAQNNVNDKQKALDGLTSDGINNTIANQIADINNKQADVVKAQTAQKQAQENVGKAQNEVDTLQSLVNNKDKTIADANQAAQSTQDALTQAQTAQANAEADAKTQQAALAPIQAKQDALTTDQARVEKLNAIRDSFYRQMNAYRVANGVQALKRDAALDALADSRAQAVADGKMNKHSAISVHAGSTLAINYTLANENSVVEDDSENETSLTDYWDNLDPNAVAKHILNSWLNSPGHKRSLMMSNFNTTGFGITFAQAGPEYGNQVWFTAYQEFAEVSGQSTNALSDAKDAFAKSGQDLVNGWTRYPAVQTIDQVNQELNDNKLAYETAQANAAKAQTTIVQAQTAVINAQKASDQAQANLKTIQDNAQNANQNLVVAKEGLAQAQKSAVTAQANVTTANNALKLAQETLSQTKANAGDKATLTEQAQTNLSQAKSQLTSAHDAQAKAQERLDAAKATLVKDQAAADSIAQQLADAQAKLSDANKRHDYLADPDALQKRVSELESKALSLSLKLMSDDANVSKAQDELTKAKVSLKLARDQQRKVQARVQTLEGSRQNHESVIIGNSVSSLPATGRATGHYNGDQALGWMALFAAASTGMFLSKKSRLKAYIDDLTYKPTH